MEYTKRVFIQDVNGLLDELIASNKKLLKKAEVWSLDEFRDNIKTTDNTLFYVMGHEFYESLRDMNDSGILHLGLRGFDYLDFMQLDFVHIGNNRLIYDPAKEFYKYEADEGKKTKKWKFAHELVEENINNVRPRLDFFLSPACEKVYLKYPHTKIVGLNEGKKVLERLDKYTIHKYDTATNYDWYRNPDKRIWENEFGFDFETFNSVEGAQLGKAFPEFVGTRCSGFALSYCDPYSDEPKAIFFDFRKDYGYDETKWESNPVYKKEYYEFLEVMKTFFDNHYKHVWAYNAAFEYAMLFNLLRKFYCIQDSYALCIADDHRGSLKFNTQLLLKSPSWDDELDADFDYFDQICGTFKSFEEFTEYEKAFKRLYTEDKTSIDLKSDIKELSKKEREIKKEICKQYGWKAKTNSEEIQEKFEKTDTYKKLKNLKDQFDFLVSIEKKKDHRFIEAMVFFSEKNPGKRMLLEQHWGDKWGATGVLPNNTEYGTKEENCLGLYCGIDAFVGERLARLLMPAYGNNCYTEILNHRYIGAELKMSGIKVDKKRLLELYRFCWNVDNNYELSSNIFVSDLLTKQNINPFYYELYNSLNDTQKYWLTNYPYYFKGGKDWAGAAFILEAYKNTWKKFEVADVGNDYIPIKEIYELLGKTCTKEKADSLIKEYELESFTIGNFEAGDKKNDLSESTKAIHIEFRERIGNMVLKYLNINPIFKTINEFALDVFKEKYMKDFYDRTAIYWIYEDVLPLSKTKVQDGEDCGSPYFINLFEHLDDSKKDISIREKYFPEVTKKMLKDLRDIPQDLLVKFKNIVPLNDKEYTDKYIDRFSWEDWIPGFEEILGKELVDQLPSYYEFKDIVNDIRISKIAIPNTDLNINIYEPLRDSNGNRIIYKKSQIMNYFSPEQIDYYYSHFVRKFNYYDYGLAIRSVALCFKQYVSYKNLDIDTNISKVDSKYLWNAMLEYLNNEEYRNIVLDTPEFTGKFPYNENDTEELKKEYDWFGKIDPKTGYTKIDTKYNLDNWGTKDALDDCCKVYKVLPYLFNTKTGIYNFFKVDGRITPPIVNEVLSESNYDKELVGIQLRKLWDLIHQGFIRQLASTCHKLITTYIPALDMGYVKKFYKENLNESGEDTVYGQWEYHEDYTLGISKDREKSIVDRKGVDYLFSDECENWFVNELPDLWCLPPYILNMVETKRNSSA